jgi:hypothetical protein
VNAQINARSAIIKQERHTSDSNSDDRTEMKNNVNTSAFLRTSTQTQNKQTNKQTKSNVSIKASFAIRTNWTSEPSANARGSPDAMVIQKCDTASTDVTVLGARGSMQLARDAVPRLLQHKSNKDSCWKFWEREKKSYERLNLVRSIVRESISVRRLLRH